MDRCLYTAAEQRNFGIKLQQRLVSGLKKFHSDRKLPRSLFFKAVTIPFRKFLEMDVTAVAYFFFLFSTQEMCELQLPLFISIFCYWEVYSTSNGVYFLSFPFIYIHSLQDLQELFFFRQSIRLLYWLSLKMKDGKHC